MAEYKICTTCGTKNQLSEYMCTNCMSDKFKPYQEEIKSKKIKKLTVFLEDLPIKLESADIVGREEKGSKLLALMTTVSRQHLRFLFEEDKWFIEDLQSTNGTYLNNLDNKIHLKTEIKDGEKLFLSRSVEMIIQIKGN